MSETTFSQHLSGKIAVVTGSTSGIGRALALAFARAGADVIVHGRRANAAEQVAAQIRRLGRRAAVVLADVARPAEIDRLVDEAWQAFGRVDVWVNNAGADILTGGALHQPFADRLQVLLDVDVRGALLCSHGAGRRMKEQGSGQIINVGWDQALTGGVSTESGQLFAASKAAVIGFSKALARGLAPEVRVNVVSPGWIETEWGETVNRELYERVRRQTPLARWGTPDDVAAAAVFLASDEAAFLTGQVVNVNGGVVM
ncbi:MAG: glucose 1-dehydrogenase [Anaerolineales bacterium]|nr:glucose 1-dehydrogenase [Anaerolineales bacterium]MCB9141710.1 glucose 1-dehydrogenase [Anaerolineales bacterium]MCO5244725.1 glucose 1-dehydrogenase [Anaerolineae bacterium]